MFSGLGGVQLYEFVCLHDDDNEQFLVSGDGTPTVLLMLQVHDAREQKQHYFAVVQTKDKGRIYPLLQKVNSLECLNVYTVGRRSDALTQTMRPIIHISR